MITLTRPCTSFDAAPKMIYIIILWFRVGRGRCILQQFARILLDLFVLTRLLGLCMLQQFAWILIMICRTLQGTGQMVGVFYVCPLAIFVTLGPIPIWKSYSRHGPLRIETHGDLGYPHFGHLHIKYHHHEKIKK